MALTDLAVAYLALLAFLVGLMAGSFFNVVILRIPKHESVLWNRSHCPHCGRTLTGWELIPVLSFVFLRGRCFQCSRGISWQYPLVELATAILFTLSVVTNKNLGAALLAVFVSAICVLVFMIDLRYQLILDRIMLPAMGVVLIGNLALGKQPLDLVLGGLIGGGLFFLQHVISRGRWVGGGDVRMGIFMGLALGLSSALFALVLAYLVGAVIAIVLILAKQKKLGSSIPFGTFLALATVVALFWGGDIVHWYQIGGLTTALGLDKLIDIYLSHAGI